MNAWRKQRVLTRVIVLLAAVTLTAVAWAVLQGPPLRWHDANQRGTLRLVPATQHVHGENAVEIHQADGWRIIHVNGLPDHDVGRFPNRGNPNEIRPQNHVYRVTLNPQSNNQPTPVRLNIFGIAINGIPFDPGAAEWWHGDPRSGWNYDALSAAVPLGLDENYAHVQPNGAYHYHGLAKAFLSKLGDDGKQHSPIVGWAADGFPIYAIYGYKDPKNTSSGIQKLRSSYRLKDGLRPDGNNGPGGRYDGTFVEDYQYVQGLGELDECNGRQTITPDFPAGTYAYFLTENWPIIPRQFRGTPADDFRRGPRR